MGDSITAIIKELDTEQKRISLSMKEATPNPWREIAERNPAGTIVKGKIRNITDFGLFVGLDEGIDGLVHVSDMSWSQRQRNPNDVYKKSDEIEVKILNIDVDNQRLSLGIKQLTEDPWQTLDDELKEGDVVNGKIVHLADFGVFLEIKPGIEGLIHISEIDKEVNKKSLTQFYPIGSEIQAKIINLKASERRLGLSVIGLSESNYKMLQERGDIVIPPEGEVAAETEAEATPAEEDPKAEETPAEEPKEESQPEEAPEAEKEEPGESEEKEGEA
jgi:small subunit ribosomal protein S1